MKTFKKIPRSKQNKLHRYHHQLAFYFMVGKFPQRLNFTPQNHS